MYTLLNNGCCKNTITQDTTISKVILFGMVIVAIATATYILLLYIQYNHFFSIISLSIVFLKRENNFTFVKFKIILIIIHVYYTHRRAGMRAYIYHT